MATKMKKYGGSDAHKRAVLHMIGQVEYMVYGDVKVRDVATWMNVCKRTALKHLKRMEANGEVVLTKVPYKNTYMYTVKLSSDTYNEYMDGYFVNDYQLYCQHVLGIIGQ